MWLAIISDFASGNKVEKGCHPCTSSYVQVIFYLESIIIETIVQEIRMIATLPQLHNHIAC